MDFAFFYRDPLFGVFLLVIIISIIAFIDYTNIKFKNRKKQESIENLAQSYQMKALNEDIINFVKTSGGNIQSLMLIAKSLSQSGDNDMAISIYLSLLEASSKQSDKLLLLEALGSTYYDAGFLERARNIFMEILKDFPRNEMAMQQLMQCFESMGEYQNALDALCALDEIRYSKKDYAKNKSFDSNEAYFKFMLLISSDSKNLKSAEDLASKFHFLRRNFLYLLKSRDIKYFWNYAMSLQNPLDYVDIFWHFEPSEVPIDRLERPLLDIFIAKGYVDTPLKNSLFELETVALFHKNGQKIDLNFEYLCNVCHNIFPFESTRCMNCQSLGTLDLILKPSRISS